MTNGIDEDTLLAIGWAITRPAVEVSRRQPKITDGMSLREQQLFRASRREEDLRTAEEREYQDEQHLVRLSRRRDGLDVDDDAVYREQSERTYKILID